MAKHNVRLLTSDGGSVTFDCGEDETLVQAAARAELFVPVLCGEGQCGTCRGTCTDGTVASGAYSPAALSAEDRARGEILMCRSYPRSDLEVTVPFSQTVLSSPAVRRDAEIIANDVIAHHTRRLVLRMLPDAEDSRAAQFEPGQFMELTTPTGVTRAYSLANTPNWSGELEFLIRMQPNGAFSGWLATEALPGMVIATRGPLGGFTLHDNGLRPRWFVAGGTGLAPLLSMLRRMAEWGEPHAARLYFGVNHEDELFALDDVERLRQEMPAVQVELCVWHPGAGWQGSVGTPTDALSRDLAQASSFPDLYLCGPPSLMAACEDAARRHGVPAESVMSERFQAT